MLNRALLVGRLTRDPELRRTSNGKAVTSFNLAVERNFKSDDQEADFINCVCWGKIAENTERYCSKGSLVSVDGRIQTRNYENNQGQKVYVTEVVADSVQFINTRRENQTAQAPVNSQAPVNNYASNGLIQQFEDEGLVMEEDDIQF
jgi:single-strand DNA-binding protein